MTIERMLRELNSTVQQLQAIVATQEQTIAQLQEQLNQVDTAQAALLSLQTDSLLEQQAIQQKLSEQDEVQAQILLNQMEVAASV